VLTDLYLIPVCSQGFSVLTHLLRPHAERVNVETANVMGASIFPDFDLKAAPVMFLFAVGVVVAAAVLSEQAADSLRLSFGVPLPASRVAHGGHISSAVAPLAPPLPLPGHRCLCKIMRR
jgi:hypothetical protein